VSPIEDSQMSDARESLLQFRISTIFLLMVIVGLAIGWRRDRENNYSPFNVSVLRYKLDSAERQVDQLQATVRELHTQNDELRRQRDDARSALRAAMSAHDQPGDSESD
jgi:hypothetical protein